MKIIKPKYYDEFKCIADKCPASCCIGWRVDVDKKSFQKYRHVQGKLKQKMNQCISRNRKNIASDHKYGSIKLDENLRCSFLNEQNLCEMFIELGEESMCTVCKTYPRYLYQFGQLYERSFTISCPVVAHTVLSQTEPMEFLLVDEALTELDHNHVVKKDMDYEIQLRLSDIRLLLITIAQHREIPIWKRLFLMRKYTDNIDKKVKERTYDENYLEVLYRGLEENKLIESLDHLMIDIETKTIVLDAISYYLLNVYGSNNNLKESIDQVQEFKQQVKEENINLEQIENEFNQFLNDKEIFFEQYIVYYLFAHFMQEVDLKDGTAIEITLLIIHYALIRRFMQVTWYKQNKQLSQGEMEKIVYSFSRSTEHNRPFIADLRKQDIVKNLSDLNGCAILLR